MTFDLPACFLEFIVPNEISGICAKGFDVLSTLLTFDRLLGGKCRLLQKQADGVDQKSTLFQEIVDL